MSAIPESEPGRVHLCLQVPEGEAAALGSLDLALTLKAQLSALGHPVSLAARQLRTDALNLVLGIGWGFDEEAAQGHRVALVTPPPAAPGAPGHAAVPWRLLQRWPVLCTAPQALAAHRPAQPDAPPLLCWRPAAVPGAAGRALAARPLDLLLPHAPTEHQRATLLALERQGVGVARLEQALHGPEWDEMLAQARAVLLPCPQPGQAAEAQWAQLALARGTAVVVETPEGAWPSAWPAELAETVLTWPQGAPWPWTPQTLATQAEAGLLAEQRWGAAALDELREALATLSAWWQAHPPVAAHGVPRRLNADPGRLGALAGWQGWPGAGQVAEPSAAEPDAAFDLIELGRWHPTTDADRLDAALARLAPEGRVVLRCPRPAGGDPAAAIVHQLAPWTHSFWQRPGPLDRALGLVHLGGLGADDQPCPLAEAHTLRVVLVRRHTGLQERSRARAARTDLGLTAA